jgi:hypothetical protein
MVTLHNYVNDSYIWVSEHLFHNATAFTASSALATLLDNETWGTRNVFVNTGLREISWGLSSGSQCYYFKKYFRQKFAKQMAFLLKTLFDPSICFQEKRHGIHKR